MSWPIVLFCFKRIREKACHKFIWQFVKNIVITEITDLIKVTLPECFYILFTTLKI